MTKLLISQFDGAIDAWCNIILYTVYEFATENEITWRMKSHEEGIMLMALKYTITTTVHAIIWYSAAKVGDLFYLFIELTWSEMDLRLNLRVKWVYTG